MQKAAIATVLFLLLTGATQAQWWVPHSDHPSPSVGQSKGSPPQPSSRNSDDDATGGQPSAQSPVKNDEGAGAAKQDDKAAEGATSKDDKAAADWSLVFWTGALAVATGGIVAVGLGQAVLFLFQLRVMRKGLADTKEAADAARDSARAARDAVLLAESTAKKQLRAYLSVEALGVERLRKKEGAGDQVIGKVRIRNVGAVPARVVYAVVNATFSPGATGAETAFPLQKDDLTVERSIQPGAHFIQGNGGGYVDAGPFTQSPDNFLYIWGTVHYGDGFTEEVRRNTQFCFRYRSASRSTSFTSKEQILFTAEEARYHEHGNNSN